ncbi:MAG: IS1595 family transposase [Acidobacteriia bacterium]|nr:IS1595 family transposase [Terriglobia bacterium]
MSQAAPGKSHREGISLIELTEMFPDEASATAWFEQMVWPKGKRHCPRCGCTETRKASATSGLPYYCSGCKRAFSVRIGTALERSKVPLRKWVFAIYLEMTSLKGVSSMKLHRDLKVTQKTAWFMLHRIREAWSTESASLFNGPVEVDEMYVGGRRKNMSNAKRRELKDTGRGAVGKVAVVGAKDRATKQVKAKVVESTDRATLHGFVADAAAPGATVYTDEAVAYEGMPFPHETVKHSVSEYVRDMAHTNGIESLWSMFKRAYNGTYHHLSEKHLNRYIAEYAGKHNLRNFDTINQMAAVAAGMVGKRLMYRDLIA